MNQGLRADVPAGMPVIPDDMQPFFKAVTKGAVMADDEEKAHNPRAASVRLRGVELIRPVPRRWRTRFDEQAQGERTAARGARRRQGHRGKARH